MTDDDKALVERLRDFVIAEDIDLAADRIEALSAEVEKWSFYAKETMLMYKDIQLEERAAIVAWLRRHKVGIAPIRVIETLTISKSQSVLTDAIEAGEHWK